MNLGKLRGRLIWKKSISTCTTSFWSLKKERQRGKKGAKGYTQTHSCQFRHSFVVCIVNVPTVIALDTIVH
jgi:hypothetical protein